MGDRPITIIAPTIARVLDGTCTVLRRPQAALATCGAGDRLWVREQYRLPRTLDFTAPLLAVKRGAVPVFAADEADLPEWAISDLGKRRFARELPRAWHRLHLVLDHVGTERLQSVTDAEIDAAGFSDRDHYARGWDAGLALSGAKAAWANDPVVLVLKFRRVLAPIPDGPSAPASAEERKVA